MKEKNEDKDAAHKSTHGGDGALPHTGDWCDGASDLAKVTIKAVSDRPIAALLQYKALGGTRKFEASDVIRSGSHLISVCDSSWDVLRVSEHMPILSAENELIGPELTPPKGDSGYEALCADESEQAAPGSFYVIRESVAHNIPQSASTKKNTSEYRARVLLIQIPEPSVPEGLSLREAPPPMVASTKPPGRVERALGASRQNDREETPPLPTRRLSDPLVQYSIVDECPSEFVFGGDSKGFEGATALRGSDGVLYLVGLCEGNHCAEGDRGKERGNGRLVVMVRADDASYDEGCVWRTHAVVPLPKEAYFTDYSAISLHKHSGAVAVSSQADSQVWVGQLKSKHGATHGHFDASSASLEHVGVYDFPRNANCEVQYCNIEGVDWIDNDSDEYDEGGIPSMLVAVSDKMKGKGKQSHACLEKDQSMHLFALPG